MTRQPFDDIDQDLREHLAQETQANIDRGMSPAEARAAALGRLGTRSQIRDQVRAVWIPVWLDQARQDAVYAWRTLLRHRSFTLAAAGTLALAIAASTAMFSVVHALILRPLPYVDPQSLVVLWLTPHDRSLLNRPDYPTVEEWRRASSTLAAIEVADGGSASLLLPSGAEKIRVIRTSPGLLPMLGVTPAVGRAFSDDDVREGRALVMITHQFWVSRFGQSPSALGAQVSIDGRPWEIVGIFGRDVRFPGTAGDADVWLPHTSVPDWQENRLARGAGPFIVFGRSRHGTRAAAVEEELTALARSVAGTAPVSALPQSALVVPLAEAVAGPRWRLTLWVLMGAVACLLLIAVSNISSLTLARSMARAGEMALRVSIGATPWRIARQVVLESLVLAGVAGCAGTLLSVLVARGIRSYGALTVARLGEVDVDLTVLSCALGLTLLTAALVAIAPLTLLLRRGYRLSQQEAGGRTLSSGALSASLRRALVVIQFALAVTLLTGGGLMVRSWWSINRVEPGYDTDRVLSLNLSPTHLTADQRVRFYERVLAELEGVAGVESAGVLGDFFVSSTPPVTITAERSTRTESRRLPLRQDEASARTFDTVHADILRGRPFTAEDGAQTLPVAIVNRTLARQLWGEEHVLGRRLKLGTVDSPAPWLTVVGVVADMRREGIEIAPAPQLFVPLAQAGPRLCTLLVRTSTSTPLALRNQVEAAIRRVDMRVPIYGVNALATQMETRLGSRRFQTVFVLAASLVALVMAGIGIYGLVLQSVVSRTREIGIRLALGAQPRAILGMTVGDGLRLSAVGLAAGVCVALMASHGARGLLFEVSAYDPATFAAVGLLLTAVAAIASYVPARRALRVAPSVALRCP